MSWFSDGFATTKSDLEEKKDQQLRNSARRFWVKTDTYTDVIFLDERAISFREHKFWNPGGGGSDEFTCLGLAGACPACLDGHEAQKVTVFSIIDTSKWSDKKGNVHENEKKLLVVYPEQAAALMEKKANWGGLSGKAVRIRRTGKTSPSSGNDFELLMRDARPLVVDLSKYKDNQPFDYIKLFSPLHRDKARILYARIQRNDQKSEAIALDGATSGDYGALPSGDAPPPSDLDESSSNIPF